LFKTIGKHVPPPPGTRSPALWGIPERMSDLFEPHASSVKSVRKHFVFRYRSVGHWLETFRNYYGPVLKAFDALDPAAQSVLEADLTNLAEQFNRSGDGTMVVPSEYLEVAITR
jgi:hypothetical protein